MKSAPVPSLRILAGAAALWVAGAAGAQPTAQGLWVTESGNLEVAIAPCGEAWCGTVVRVLANRSMSEPGQEMAAADPRPPLGMKILIDLRPDGEGQFQGQIYNRENAKHYSVRLTLDGPEQMRVRPYIGLPVFGKTQWWRRSSPGAEPR